MHRNRAGEILDTDPPPSTGSHAESFELVTLWEVVRDCRSRIGKSFGYLGRELADALALAVSELAENVVKYAALESAMRPSLTVRVTATRICVRSENSARTEYDARLACSLVAKVAAEMAQLDPALAYARAIEQTLARKKGLSRQGFYRIAAVGGFQLRAERNGKLLSIIGERTR
ncbi:MAG: hypothetical protein ABI895_13205 [Deltaproteobacteria bacterium]